MDLITTISGKKMVSLFSSEIIVDRQLPKYKTGEEDTEVKARNIAFDEVDVEWVSSDFRSDAITINSNTPKQLSLWEQLLSKVGLMKVPTITQEMKKLEKEESTKMSVMQFFKDIKVSLNDSEWVNYEKTIENYRKELARSKQMGQTALFENLKKKISVVKQESVLQSKQVKYLTQEQLLTLGDKTKRGIKLDYIKNFVRIIPDDIYDKKVEADTWCIYDNYVVMHYDPSNTASQMTEKEKKEEEERKKDPILFGVIKGSTNLYYIGDWIDEYCDLTLEKALEIINDKKENA